MKLWIFGSIQYWRPDWASWRGMRFLWQKITRGFSDSDTWALDYTIAKFVLPRLKCLRKMGFGHPACYEHKQWWGMVDRMIWSMEQIAKGDGGSFIHQDGLTDEEVTAYYNRLQEGLTLFGRNFRGLWW